MQASGVFGMQTPFSFSSQSAIILSVLDGLAGFIAPTIFFAFI
jgi:hypothetical protein